VRDVASAHLKALEKKEANGKRFILCSENLWMNEICDIYREKYGSDYNISSMEVSKCVIYIASFFDPLLADSLKVYGKDIIYDNL